MKILNEHNASPLLSAWRPVATAEPPPAKKVELCVHELFERQAERTPHAVAVRFEEQQLTYAELNARANQLARYLRGLGVGPEVLVGIYLERSLDVIAELIRLGVKLSRPVAGRHVGDAEIGPERLVEIRELDVLPLDAELCVAGRRNRDGQGFQITGSPDYPMLFMIPLMGASFGGRGPWRTAPSTAA